MDRRATCLNCMDGRVQMPVQVWIKQNYPVDFVDVITEAGMDHVLANQKDISEVVRSINISVKLNKSNRLFVVGHHDCRGNPVTKDTHHEHIQKAVVRLKEKWPSHEVIGLWVNDSWSIEIVK